MSEEFEKELTEMTNVVTNIAASNGENAPMGKIAGILGAAKTPEAAQVLKMAIDQELAAQKAAMGVSTEPQPASTPLENIQDRLAKVTERDEALFNEKTVIPEVNDNTVGIADSNQVATQDVIDAGIPESETTVCAPDEPMAIDAQTGEQKVVTIDDENSGMEPITETFDEYMERHKDDGSLDDIEIKEESAADVIKDRYTDMSFDDAKELAIILKKWQNKEISSMEAYNSFPAYMTANFSAQLMKAGVPAKVQATHKKEFAKSILEDLASSTQMKQATDELNENIQLVYDQYGDDINVLYQAGIYEKINQMKTAAAAMKSEEYSEEIAEKFKQPKEVWEESRNRKVEDLEAIVESLYESFTFTKFAKRIGHIKAKQIDLTNPKRCFTHFASKYVRTKFSCADVSTIIPILEQQCEFTHDQAVEFAVVFCEYCKNMRPTNIAEHVFMYYTIANINSLSVKVGDKAALFAEALKDNLKAIWAIREAKGNGEDYVAKQMSEEDVATLLQISEEVAKEAQEEAADEQETAPVEEELSEKTESSEESEANISEQNEVSEAETAVQSES